MAGCGVGLGAGLMYVLDPDRGRRRRALLRDRASHTVGEALDALGKNGRDVRNRARGFVAEAGAHFRCEQVSDEMLAERVRSRMGHAVSEPGEIEVLTNEGQVTLRGVVPAGEVDRLLRRVSGVRGVRGVESQLNVKGRHDAGRDEGQANGHGVARRAPESLSAPARVLATVAGSSLALYGAKRRGVVGSVVGFIGMRVLTRGLGNSGLHRRDGAGGNGKGAA